MRNATNRRLHGLHEAARSCMQSVQKLHGLRVSMTRSLCSLECSQSCKKLHGQPTRRWLEGSTQGAA